MKIGIDATPLSIPFPCGTKHYSKELIENLAKIDRINEYVIFAPKKVDIPQQSNFKLIIFPQTWPILKRQLFLTQEAIKEHVDIFHYLEPFGSAFFEHPRIITTVNDVSLSHTYPLFSKLIFNRVYCEIVRYATLNKSTYFITPTNFISDELKSYLKNIKGEKVSINTVYDGVDNDFRIIKRGKTAQNKFLLCMGDFAIRKNIKRAIEAYSLLPSAIRKSHSLKIVASTPDSAKRFSKLCQNAEISSFVEIITSPSKEELVKLYNNATLFIYPSFYEGFGLPILEAMACGCPVITSNLGAMKEVANNAALLIDPYSIIEISKAILKIVNNPNLAHKYIRKGLDRAKDFTWEQTAQKTLQVYNNCLRLA